MARHNATYVLALLAAGTFGAQAQAHTILRTLPKSGLAYAVSHAHPAGGYTVRNASDCPRTVIRRAFRSKVTLVCPDQ